MTWQELIGLMAGLVSTTSFVPQVVRLFRLKSAHEISLPFTLAFSCGVAMWLVYGVSLSLMPVIVWNAVTLSLALMMLWAKLFYGR